MYHVLLFVDPNGADFRDVEALEAASFPILAEYGAERLFCLRHLDGTGETQLYAFPSEEAYADYMQDTRWIKARAAPGLEQLRADYRPVAMI